MRRVLHQRPTLREDGFTMIEMAIASGIVMAALLLVAAALTTSFTAVGVGRQRQSANSLANQTMEQLRSLPLDALAKGHSTTDGTISQDPSITSSGCGASHCFKGERLVIGSDVSLPPLNPHRRSDTVGPTTYTVYTYLTQFSGQSAYRATVVVTWPPLSAASSGRVEVESVLHSPEGCLSTTTKPFAGPCQAHFTANARQASGSVTITGSLQNINLTSAEMTLPSSNSDLLAEQISVVQGRARGAGALLTAPTEQFAGGDSVASVATNHPDEPGKDYDSNQQATSDATAQVQGSSSNSNTTFALTSTAATDFLRSTSTTSAHIPSRLCPNFAGSPNGWADQADEMPCGASRTQQSGTWSANLGLRLGSNNIGQAILARASAQTAASISVTDRSLQPDGTTCADTTDEGCVRATAHRAAQDIQIGGLPAGLSALFPGAWDGYYVHVSAIEGTANAEAGIGVSAPSISQESGTIRYWSGSGYANVSVLAVPQGGIVIAPLTVGVPSAASVTITGRIDPGALDVQDPADPVTCPTTCTRENVRATFVSPTMSLDYTVVIGGVTVAQLQMVVDPGMIEARASYEPAPEDT